MRVHPSLLSLALEVRADHARCQLSNRSVLNSGMRGEPRRGQRKQLGNVAAQNESADPGGPGVADGHPGAGAEGVVSASESTVTSLVCRS